MQKATLDKSGAYSKLSAKAELNLQLSMALQLATCSVTCWKFAIFVYPQISACMHKIQKVTEQCLCEGILTELEQNENIEELRMPELERHGRPELGMARLLLSQGAVNWIMSQPYGDYLTAKHEKVVLANP